MEYTKIMDILSKFGGVSAFYPSAISKRIGCTEDETIEILMKMPGTVEPVYEIRCPECDRTVEEGTSPSDDWAECFCGYEFNPSAYEPSLKFRIIKKTA